MTESNKKQPIPNLDKLILELKTRGYSEKVAMDQINELSEIIWLSALDRLAKEKNLNLSEIKGSDVREKLEFLEKNVTPEEFLRVLEVESEEKISEFLKAIS